MKRSKSIVVEDDHSSFDHLKLLIEEHFPQIEIISHCTTIKDSAEKIDTLKPDLVFLDIELPDGYGFDIFEKIKYRNFDLIFVTAYNDYAVRAFDFAALHYLVKPVTKDSLQIALERHRQKASVSELDNKLKVVQNNLTSSKTKIMLPTGNGLEIFDINEIVRCEADDNYTNIYFKDKKYLIVTRNLSQLENILSDVGFYRIHRKYLVNVNYVRKVKKSKTDPVVVMSDGAQLSISEARMEEFLEYLNNLVRKI